MSFLVDGPLDLRMDRTPRRDGAPSVSGGRRTTSSIAVLRDHGDVRRARRLARAILDARVRGRLAHHARPGGAGDRASAGPRHPRRNAQVFQALRIWINDESEELEAALDWLPHGDAPGGVVVTLAYHSGEDRTIKQAVRGPPEPRSRALPGRARSRAPRGAVGRAHPQGRPPRPRGSCRESPRAQRPAPSLPEEARMNRQRRSHPSWRVTDGAPPSRGGGGRRSWSACCWSRSGRARAMAELCLALDHNRAAVQQAQARLEYLQAAARPPHHPRGTRPAGPPAGTGSGRRQAGGPAAAGVPGGGGPTGPGRTRARRWRGRKGSRAPSCRKPRPAAATGRTDDRTKRIGASGRCDRPHHRTALVTARRFA